MALTDEQKKAELAKIKTAKQNDKDKADPVISDPSSKKAPNGKHYSVNDLTYLVNTEGLTLDEAYIRLAADERYKKASDTQPSKDKDKAETDNNQQIKSSTAANATLKSDADKQKNAQLAKEHPDMVVDGVYYATKEARDVALKAKEERIKQESAQATKQAEAEAQSLAGTLTNIQNTLYGADNKEAVEQLEGSIGGVELNAVLGDASSTRSRQKLLNFKNFISDYKEPSSGKPPNNKDAFPVDQKIEEFEAHQPTIKIHQLTTHVHGKEAAIAAMHTSDMAEKRIVHLENNMATVMRYLFRLGSRVMINCVYYGGQTTFEKYKCIRCMNSDRIGDGQMMQIDQCLVCTRFEPVFGQVYEIMNNLGVNVAQVLDDNQMSYMNNEDYIRMSRTEEYQVEHEKAKFTLSEVTTAQNQDDQGFDPIWGNGIKMNWNLVPLEEQKCHINWRQSINDDGSSLGHLGSWMDQVSGMGGINGDGTNNQKKVNIYVENQKSMDANKGNSNYGKWVQEGIDFVGNKHDAAVTAYMNDSGKASDAVGSSKDIDVIAVVAAATAKGSTDYAAIVSEYRKTMTAIGGSQNPGFVWTAMCSSVDIVKMYIEGTLDQWIAAQSSDSDNDAGGTTKVIPKPKNTIEAITVKETNLVMQGTSKPLGTVKGISIHHLGGGFDLSASSIHQDHMNKKGLDNRGIGYHYVIRWDGTIERGRPEAELGSHTGYDENSGIGNAGLIGICVSGTWNDDGPNNGGHPNPSDAQIKSLIGLVADIAKRHSLTVTRDNVKGHYEWYGSISDRGHGCPGVNLQSQLDNVVKSVATGTYVGAKEQELWTSFIPKVKQALEIQKKIGTEQLGFFPKICFLYTNLLAAMKNSQLDGPEWGFPFTDEQIRTFEGKLVYRTGWYNEPRSDHQHEGVDLQPGGSAGRFELNIEVCAVKAGRVYTSGQWCNGIYIAHDDNTWSRYLHLKSHLVKEGDRVEKGQAIGYVGGHNGSSNTAYAFHLHIEFGEQKGKAPYEKVFNDNCGINPEEQWVATSGSGSGYPTWVLKE